MKIERGRDTKRDEVAATTISNGHLFSDYDWLMFGLFDM